MNSHVQDDLTAADIAARLANLCEWAAEASAAPLPAAVRRRAALVLADDIAAMAVASRERQVADAQAMIMSESGAAQATVFMQGAPKVSKTMAAQANGLSITWAELDEGFRPTPCHGGAYAIPALLAEAEAGDATLSEVLRALAVSYDISTRIALTFPFRKLTVHPHGGFHAIGAAAALASLRGYDAATFRATITAAATMVGPGPFNHATTGALVRNVWTSVGAVAGFRAADFAPLGIAGLDTALTDVFLSNFAAQVDAPNLDIELGTGTWQIGRGYHKMYACCQYMHAAVEAALKIAEAHGTSRADRIQAIEVDTHALGLALSNDRPETVLAAKFSIPHAMAAVALMGSAGAEGFEGTTLDDPQFADLRNKVSLLPHNAIGEWPNDRPGRVRWTFTDGTVLSAESLNARGGLDQPFSDAELFAKFDRQTADCLPNAGKVLHELVETSSRDKTRWRDLVAVMN